jgi:dephospho-CoA kinase
MTNEDRRWWLTGGIGSGKSVVRRLLADAGLRTLDADAVGHDVLETEARAAVGEKWPDVVVADGSIDRRALGRVVFDEPDQLAELEAITHPYIFERIAGELEGFDGVAVVEIPVMGSEKDWPTIVVDSRDEMRVERIIERGLTRDEAIQRLTSQPTRGEWLARADLVIPNHGSLDQLEETVSMVMPILTG